MDHAHDLAIRVIHRISVDPLSEHTAAPTPYYSLQSGLAGVALFWFTCFCATDNVLFLFRAERWLRRSVLEMPKDQQPGEIQQRLNHRPNSLLHGPIGVYALAACIYAALGDETRCLAAIDPLIHQFSTDDRCADFFLGRAGALFAASATLGFLNSGKLNPPDKLREFVKSESAYALLTLRKRDDALDLALAHGTAGCVLAIECASRGLRRFRPSTATVTLKLATMLRERPPSLNGSLCNGSAGYALLFAACTGCTDGASLARHFAFLAGQATGHSVPSICCGYAGQSLALTVVYARTHESCWLTRATELVNVAAALADRGDYKDTDWFNFMHGPLGVALAYVCTCLVSGKSTYLEQLLRHHAQ